MCECAHPARIRGGSGRGRSARIDSCYGADFKGMAGMYVCRKMNNSQARTGHQRGMGGRGTDDDDTHEQHTDTNKLTRHTASIVWTVRGLTKKKIVGPGGQQTGLGRHELRWHQPRAATHRVAGLLCLLWLTLLWLSRAGRPRGHGDDE